MSFRVEFRRRLPLTVPDPSLTVPEPVHDYQTDVIEACAVLAQVEAGEFVMSGFGRNSWPLDVAYDMSAFMEQFPDLLHGVRSGSEVEVDLYGQGIESTLLFRPEGEEVEIACRSGTAWQPDPAVETIARRELIEMLQALAGNVALSLASAAPRLASVRPFDLWIRGVF